MILCWNCQRLGNPSTIHTLERYVIAKAPQVSFLCETRLKKACLDHVKRVLDIEGRLSVDSGQGCIGLALLWNKHVGCVFYSYSKLYINVTINDDDDIFRFMSIHRHSNQGLKAHT
ncbi:hypothetical protein GQ457_06G009360 [Hibiscus cannabinus]